VRDDLYGLSKIITPALLVYYRLVNPPCGDVVDLGGMNIQETFIMTEIKISLGAVNGDITLSMLIWIKRSRINIYIRIKLLNGHRIAACLKELRKAGRNDTLAQR
jgi:hypothetical protein